MTARSWSEGKLFGGMTLGPWLRLLARNRLAVSPGRVGRALMGTLLAASNVPLSLAQRAIFGRAIARVKLPDDPLFIVGHWRSGTTLLHELLALDERNRCPTTYECLEPHHFLVSERFVRRRLPFLMPTKRPWDNMPLGFDHPQEDETALCCLGAPSPFLTVAFPNRPPQDPPYVDLAELTPRELQRWQAIVRRFYRSVLYRRAGRLILKSPQHSFRIPVLERMFPQARFVRIVRDPYVIYSSTLHFWTTTYQQFGLQSSPFVGVEDRLLDTFCRLHDALDAAEARLPANRFAAVRYEELIADPVGQIAGLYERLELGSFEPARAAIAAYAQETRDYQTNRYELSAGEIQAITARWRPYIERYGYTVRNG
jgi:hypothetical protein